MMWKKVSTSESRKFFTSSRTFAGDRYGAIRVTFSSTPLGMAGSRMSGSSDPMMRILFLVYLLHFFRAGLKFGGGGAEELEEFLSLEAEAILFVGEGAGAGELSQAREAAMEVATGLPLGLSTARPVGLVS